VVEYRTYNFVDRRQRQFSLQTCRSTSIPIFPKLAANRHLSWWWCQTPSRNLGTCIKLYILVDQLISVCTVEPGYITWLVIYRYCCNSSPNIHKNNIRIPNTCIYRLLPVWCGDALNHVSRYNEWEWSNTYLFLFFQAREMEEYLSVVQQKLAQLTKTIRWGHTGTLESQWSSTRSALWLQRTIWLASIWSWPGATWGTVQPWVWRVTSEKRPDAFSFGWISALWVFIIWTDRRKWV